MQPIPRDSNDNGVVTMLVYHNKPTLLLTVHQHGGDDVTYIRSIGQLNLMWNLGLTAAGLSLADLRLGEVGKKTLNRKTVRKTA